MTTMVYSLTYHRPALISSSDFSRSSLTSADSIPGIPDALSFNRIVEGGTCPPCTLRDFMNYLLYIEFAAENLLFYLWFKDYAQRFEALSANEKALSGSFYVGKDCKPGIENQDERDINGSAHSQLTPLLETSNITLQPFTIQPYRQEISKVIATYISEGANHQLNLSSKERADLLRNLAVTTHPSAFEQVLRTVIWTLKHQAHPNFVRWTIRNGNRPRWIFARSLGFSCVVAGVLICALLTASSIDRAWRIIGGAILLIGISTLFAAWKGMCVVLHGMHHRHLRPWELFTDDNEIEFEIKRGTWDPFGPKASHENQPWLVKYEKRNIIRKIFDREVWIQEPALRQIQDTIFIQSLLVALLITIIVVGVFCAIPPGNHY